jgi:hypothetical protein
MHPDARCLECGYLLRGLSEARCPECGRGFSAEDLATVNCGRPYGPRVAWILRPTKWIALWAPWVAWGIFSIAAILLFERLIPLVILALVWIVFLLPYAVRGTMRNLAVRLYRQPREFRRVDRANVRRIFLAFSPPFALMIAGLPLHIPFYASLPWINAVAQRAYQTGQGAGPYPPPQWAGFYRVQVVNVTSRSVIARVGGSELLFYPGPSDHSLPGYFPWEMIPIGGGWYRAPLHYLSPRPLLPWGW